MSPINYRANMLRLRDNNDANFWELTLFRLSGLEYSEVRQALAGNLETPIEALQILSHDTDTLVLGCLVCNPNTPMSVLHTVAVDRALIDDWLARFEADFTFDAELLWAMFNLGDGDLEFAIAQHPAAPPELLKQIVLYGCDEYCQENAANNPNANTEILWELRDNEGMYGFLTQHPKATAELLEYIADVTLRSEGLVGMWFTGQMENLLSHPNAPRETLELALGQDNSWLAGMIVDNISVPEDLRERACRLVEGGNDQEDETE